MSSAKTIRLRLSSSVATHSFSRIHAAAARRLSYSPAAMSLSSGHRHHHLGQPISATTPATPNNYPVPLSPPLPAISKPIELSRAMSASSRSNLFVLERDRIVYEDEWLIAVNKPLGIYCESVLGSVPHVLGDSGMSADTDGVIEGTSASNSWVLLSGFPMF